jgi:threonine dehydratase
MALELLREAEGLDAIIVPLGGGGLIARIATATKSLRPEIEIFGVEAARYPSMLRALEGGEPQFGAYTIAEGIAVKEPGRYTLPVVRQLVDRILLADEADIEEAVLLLLEVEKTVAEGAGTASLAAVRRNLELVAGRRSSHHLRRKHRPAGAVVDHSARSSALLPAGTPDGHYP